MELIDQGTRLIALPPTGSSFEASIRDDETLTASIVASAESVVEGSNTTFTVTLMGGVTEDGVSVAFEAGGTATEEDYGRPTGAIMLPPDDASGRVGVLEIRAGQTSGTITYPILLDNSEEDGETLDVEIYSVSSGAKAATVSSTEYLASTMILDRGTLIASIAGTPSPDEGQAGTFTIFISKTSDAPESVNWATRQVEMGPGGGQVAREGVDLPATSGRVEIPAGSTSATFTASTTQDTLVEGDEIFGVTLEEAREDSDNVPLGVTSATGTIVDDDAAPAGLTISVSPTGVDEDAGPTDLTVTVELDGTTQFPVDTPVSVGMVNRPNVSNNATLGVDYTSTTANVEIPAGQSSATTTVTLTPVDDSYSEGDEIARLNARSPVFTDAAGRAVWIRDNDMEPVEVGLDAVPGTVIESASTQQLTVTATLMGQSSREIDTVVTVELADNTATVGEDFETATATLTIPAGEVSAVTTVTLTLLDDNIAEGAETLSVAGTVPGSIIVTPAEVTIVDDDAEPNAIGISVMAPPLNEGGATTTLPVRATLLGGSTRGVDTEVTLSVEDLTATVNDDYTAAWDSPVLTISAGDLSAIANLTLAPVDNTLHEEDEQLAVRGANTDPGLPVNGVRLTIEDDDPVPEKIILTLDRSSVPESYGTVLSDVTATLDGGSTIDSDAEISITVESNAQETRTYGGILQDGLSIEAGQSSGTTKIYVAGLNDDVDDDEVIVMVRGTTDTSGLTIKAARLRVSDDDTSGVRVSPTSLDIQEGRRGQYSVSLTSEPTANVVVTIDVPANAGFTVNPGILTFTPLSWGWQNVYVDALVDLDGDDEPAADITHSLGSTDTKYDGAATENVSVTVRDTTSSTVRVEPTELDIAEGASSTYTVILDTQPTGDVTVTVEGHSGTGVSVDSPILTFTTVNWATPQDVTVTANQDDDAIDESVTLTNTVSGGGYGSVIAADVDVEVTDDDDVGVTVSPTELTVIEGQEGGYTVVLTSEPAGNVTVTVNDPGNTDVTADPAVLTFTPTDWDDEQTVTVTAVIDNDTVDDTATVTHTVESTGDSTYDGTSTADVTVTVEELQLVTVSFEQAAYTVAEGGTVTVRVQLSADPERTVTIPISSTNQDGATGADYSGVPANVVFNSGDTEKDITFTATQDTIDDDDESVKLTFGTLPTGVSEGNTDEATVSISDDDVPSVDVSFEQGMYTVAEGGSVTVKVKLDADPERTVSIPISKTDQGGASNSDYSGVPTNVVFDSGDTEQTFTFIATQDTVDDDGESVKLTLSSLPEGVTAGSPSETVVSITDDDVPDVMVSFGASSYTVAEGGSVTVTVKLGADPERIVEVPITVAHLGGASSTDFSGVPDTVTFQPGDTEETFDFTATHDTVDDDDESVKLTFGSLPARVTSTGPSQAIVSITDDDVPEVTVSFEQESYTVAEGGTVTVKVQMDADPERMVTIPLTKADQDGASNSDYSGVPANVVFDSGDTEKMFTFTATSDNDNDDDESVKLGFGTLPTGVSTGSTNEATVSITDDDVPDVTVSFSAGSYSAEEGGTVEVTLTLSVAPERAVTIPLTKTEQGGATSTDYSGVPADVRFGASDTEQTFTFTAADDTVNDDGESVKLGFGTLPTGVSDGTNSEATVNITDGDVPTVNVSFEHGTYTIAEGATETIKVKLSAAPERSVTISILRLDEHGATSADYSGVPSSVTFNSGDTEKTFTFTAESDNQNDDGESVRLSFGSMPAGVNAGTNINTTISITDDDVPDVSVSFATSTYAVAEGSSVMVKVRLSADPERSVTIPLTSTEQGGASNSDYSGVPTSVTIASGDTEVTFAFAAATDSNYDDGESVKLTFGTLPAGVSGGSTDETTISITDDAPAVTVSFGSSSYTVAEGSSVTVKVKLSADPERDVEVPITVATLDGASSADFSGVPSTVMFESGDTEKTFSFSAIQDTVDDDGEKVSLTFGMLPGGVTSTGPSQAVVSITDDDDPAVTVRFQRGTYTVIEGGSINITVIMSPDPERTIRIPLRVMNQGGATDDDHSLIPEAITFNAGQTSRIFTFQADEDTIDDDGESVKIGFYNTLPTGVSPGTTYETVVSITDDDVPAVTVSYGASSYTVTEGSSVAVKVKLSADPERTVEVPITVAHLGGASSTDFSGVTEKVTFSSGDTEKTFLFSATQDTVDDDGEKVSLTFGTLPTGVSEGSTKESVVSITDDDVLAVTVSFSAGSYSAEEGGTVEVTLTLSAAPGRAVTIPLTKTEQGGASNSDYSGVPTSISFGSGDTDKTFAFTATSDNDNDDDESVKLGFGTLPTGVSAGSTDEATVSITDNDYPFVTVSFEQAAYTVVEGATTTIRVTLSADPERSVTIPLTTAKQGGASNSDYSGVPASVVFDSGDTQKTLTFTATQDSFDDDGERVRLGFGSTLPPGVSPGTTNETTVSITDDDDPQVTVSFEHATYTVAEGATTTITIRLSADPERTVSITILKLNQGGASPQDYSGVPTSVMFNSGDTVKTFGFGATQDEENDNNESVRLTLGSQTPPGVGIGTNNSATVSITDDDVPDVKVSYPEGSYTVTEGATVQILVALDMEPERQVVIPVSAVGQNGATTADYLIPDSVTFSSGDTEKTFTFTATDDSDDDDETVWLRFGMNLPTGVTADTSIPLGDNRGLDNATVSIMDNDHPAVQVTFAASTHTVAEGATTTVTVYLSPTPGREVTVPLITNGQNGATTADYLIPASVTFNSGDIEKTFVFSATQDTDDDDPRVSVSFEQGSYTVEEGGSVTVKVKLSADPERSVTISILKLNQDGAGSEDYSGVPTSVTFNSGDTEKTFSFSATQDTTDDDGESVKLSFGARPPGVDLGAPDETTVSITDDDVPDVSVSFATSTYSVAEGATTTIEVVLSADPERIVSIPITSAAQGGATSTDYSGVPSTIRFNAGDTRASFVFSATQDDEDDNDESVKLTLGGLPGGVSTGTPDETTVSIVDDDAVAQPQVAVRVSFDSSGYGLSEGGTAVVTLTLDADPGGTVVIPITSTRQGGATSADYSGVPTVVTFNSGDTTKSFTFTAVQDDVDEDDESVLLGFGSLPTGVSLGTTIWSTTVTITDDDTAGVTLGTMTLRVDEGAASTYTVVLTSDPEGSVTVTVNDPTDNTDVTTDPANLTFTGGTWNTEQTVTVSAADDNDSVDETATITHTVSGYGSVTAGDVQVTVLDDEDPTVTADFEQSTYMVTEGSSVTVKVTLSADPERTVTIPLSKTDLGGATSTDYTGVPGNVVFNSGDTEKTFDFSAATDSDNDDGESVKLGFGTMPAGVSGGSTDETTVTITDDDVPAVEVSFEQSTYTAAGGSSVTVKVKLSADPERTVTIPLTKANQGGATSTDYSGVPANVVFNGGDTEKSFDFSAATDSDNDDGESVVRDHARESPGAAQTRPHDH